MANMSYCRFQNTVNDLRDCWEHFDDASSLDELRARRRMYEICRDIVDSYDLSDLEEAVKAEEAADET